MQICPIETIEHVAGGITASFDNGWNLFISNEELGDFVPAVGDIIETGPSIGRPIQFITIAGHVVRNVSDEEQEAKHQEMVAGFRRKKEEAFAEHGDEWKAEAANLLPVLRDRIQRFVDEQGDEFWIDSGSYELYAIKAADVLARHVREVFPGDVHDQLEWIDWWNDLNSKEHDYNYKRQMELLPEFGDGHSGNTHGAAIYYAKRAVQGLPC